MLNMRNLPEAGVGSDVIQKRLGMSRYWFVALASVVFSVAQLSAIGTANPHHLWVVSGLSGRECRSPPPRRFQAMNVDGRSSGVWNHLWCLSGLGKVSFPRDLKVLCLLDVFQSSVGAVKLIENDTDRLPRHSAFTAFLRSEQAVHVCHQSPAERY